MADVFSPEERSEIMRRVKGKDTSLERRVRSALFKRGLRFRKHYAGLPGKPDVVFPGAKVAVFIDSCFWHGCPEHLRMPKSNRDYWENKIARNRARDEERARWYAESEWTMLRFWEHDLKERFDDCLDEIEAAVRARRAKEPKRR